VFALSDDEREKLSKATVSDFYNKYKTPFERVRDDLRDNYGIDNPSRALFNIYIQGSKHYEGFSTRVNDSMKLEEAYMSKIVEGCVTTLIDINRVYIKNVGNLFIESFDLSLLLQFNNKTSTNLIISRCQYYSIVRKCFFYEFTQNY